MTPPPKMKFAHLGLFVTNVSKMIDFYTGEFGLVVTDRGISTAGKEGAFLSGDPAEHHQLVFVEGREPGTKPTTNQISFRVDNLAALLRYAKHCQEADVTVSMTKNHGNAWSIYVTDPEDNTVEVYCTSPWYVSQPVGAPLDVNDSEDAILEKTETLVRANPTFLPREKWMTLLAAKINSRQAGA